MTLEIIFQNEDLVAINKPHGLLVHKTNIAADATEFALQLLRDQINQKVYPVHRLDRKTSGVLLFAKNKTVLSEINKAFTEGEVKKTYLAIVRGYIDLQGRIEYDLTTNSKKQSAITEYTCLEQFEIPLAHGNFKTSRYSLVELIPETGRFHQLRKHMAHIFHPILGDRPHGCNKQNKLWKETYKMDKMMLHAKELNFKYKGKLISIQADTSKEFKGCLEILKNV
jgi:tRNA pseudouridine65 synthase